MKPKGSQINRAVLREGGTLGKITIPDFKIYHRAVVCYWHKIRYVNQRTKVEDPNTSTCKDSHLILDKDAKTYTEQ